MILTRRRPGADSNPPHSSRLRHKKVRGASDASAEYDCLRGKLGEHHAQRQAEMAAEVLEDRSRL